jgi:hypothetical protein
MGSLYSYFLTENSNRIDQSHGKAYTARMLDPAVVMLNVDMPSPVVL